MIKTIVDWCNRHDRHRTILDRDGKSPYMERYYLLFKDRKYSPINVVMHNILRSDLDDLHDHPWPYFTLILKGGYWETVVKVRHADGTILETERLWRKRGWFAFRGGKCLHKLEVEPGVETWTLFIMGPQYREWGFIKNNKLWTDWQSYLKERNLNV